MNRIADEFDKTQPILETLLLEMRQNNATINERLTNIENHLNQQDVVTSNLTGQLNLAGNIAADAKQQVEDLAADLASVHSIVKRIDQALLGTTELAKSGFDLVTAIRSANEPERRRESDWPTIEVEDYDGKYSIVGTGV